MRVIITGGTGLIGSALAKSLLADGHEVIVLSRNPGSAKIEPGVRIENWTARSGDGWSSLITSDTAIINLAGAGIGDKRWSEDRKKLILESRVNAGAAVVDAIEKASEKPRVVIQSSAVGYYGTPGDQILTEDSPAGDDFQADVCKQWEDSTKTVEGMEVRRVVIRSGVVLSMDGGAFPRMLLPFKLMVGGPIGNGSHWFPWIHIDDEIKAIRFLIENEGAKGVFNVMAPNPLTNGDFTHEVGKIMQKPAVIPVPKLALQLMFGEMAIILIEGQRAIPKRLQEHNFEFVYPTVEPALKNLFKK
ncbi:MAG: epimerase [Chloroflexota bacterium]|nr:TIGR01777 family protein [Chloroflexota bacterium]NOG65774.1 TIGR01777 family protein [Chloroflexota bacterium]GIK67088.1 MAG: epimerase [Chloroflexota bacterium]